MPAVIQTPSIVKRIGPKRIAAKKPRKAKTATKGIVFQSKGPAKRRCVKVDGVSKRGVHKSIEQKLCPFDYSASEKNHTLLTLPMPKANYFVSSAGCAAVGRTRKYPPGNQKQQGSKLDRQASVYT